MFKKSLFQVVPILLTSIMAIGQNNCPAPDSECPGGPCVTKIFCDDFETAADGPRTGYDYTKNQVATLDTHTIAFQTNNGERQWRTDFFVSVFASKPGTIGLAHEPPYTSEFYPPDDPVLRLFCPAPATGLRRACSRTLKTFPLNAANFFRITGVTGIRRETTGSMPSKVAWFNQQFVTSSATSTYYLGATLQSIQTSTPPTVCFCPEYQKDAQIIRPQNGVCIFANQVDPTNNFVKVVTAVDLRTTANQVKIQAELRDMSNALLTGCFVSAPPYPPSDCKLFLNVPLAPADYQALTVSGNKTVARLYPVVCNDAAQPRVVEIDRVSVAETTAFEFPF